MPEDKFKDAELNQLDLEKVEEKDLHKLSDVVIKKILLKEKNKSATPDSHSSSHQSNHSSQPY